METTIPIGRWVEYVQDIFLHLGRQRKCMAMLSKQKRNVSRLQPKGGAPMAQKKHT